MARPPGGKSDARPRGPRTREDIDLDKAYAIRAQREKEERIEAERLKQEEARKRREAKARLAELVKDKGLNDPAAEIARHFDYGGKIKRIYVNATQLHALNAGELGVVQIDGRYLLVDAALLAQAEAIFAPAIALKVPVILKPGREEPWTPYRLIQALIAAGARAFAHITGLHWRPGGYSHSMVPGGLDVTS